MNIHLFYQFLCLLSTAILGTFSVLAESGDGEADGPPFQVMPQVDENYL